MIAAPVAVVIIEEWIRVQHRLERMGNEMLGDESVVGLIPLADVLMVGSCIAQVEPNQECREQDQQRREAEDPRCARLRASRVSREVRVRPPGADRTTLWWV